MTTPTSPIPWPCTPESHGVFSLDLLAADAPEKIRYWVKERKLSGLRLYMGGHLGKQLTGCPIQDISGWECAAELGIPVSVTSRPEGLSQLMTLAKQFPRCPSSSTT